MKEFNVSMVFSTVCTTDYDVIFESDDLHECELAFEKACNVNGSKPDYELSVKERGDYLSLYVSLGQKVEDEVFYDDIKTLTLYEEGPIDRMNYKGDYAVMYWFEARYDKDKGQKVYNFFFHGESEEGEVLESDLNKWFYY